MGREVRKVPKDWVHPVGDNGPVPLHDRMIYEPEEIAEGIRDIMPQWKEEEKTHFQMYETCSACGDMTANYEQWLATIKAGYAPTMVLRVGKDLVSGVEDSV